MDYTAVRGKLPTARRDFHSSEEISMARLPLATRESVPENQRTTFDELVQGYGSVPRFGPGSVLIHVPKVHQIMNALNRYLRNESTLPKKLQELAMLVTAREMDCQYIWNAHAASARQNGVSDAIVDALRERKELPRLAADELAVVGYAQEYFVPITSVAAPSDGVGQLRNAGRDRARLVFGNYNV
jgi:4-carboxymuconolactone decarboxylase